MRLGAGMVRGSLVIGILVLVTGCHARHPTGDETFLERVSRVGGLGGQAVKPGALAEEGLGAITDQCAKQSYETASKGLIVNETGLHEDVFALRNRISYGEIAYGLDDALRLESLLDKEAGNSANPKDQQDCIREFAQHMESLTDPMVEEDAREKELDVSAYKDSAKEADEQTEKKLREPETPAIPKPQSLDSLPQSY
ncbi:MAG: hypothetical protein ACRD3K_02890 [Edaphobacter sp.]